MAKCCCCINVRTGALILGFLGTLFAVAELVPLVPYLAEWDQFNPIKENMEKFFYVFEQMLEEHQFNKEQIDEIIANIKEYLWPIVLGETISAGVYILISVLLMVGVQCTKRGLMLPYLIIQMACIVLFVVAGIAATVGLFILNLILGVVCGCVVLVSASLLIYFWIVVQRAYVDVGRYGDYSPAPTVKPIYVGSNSHHYPAMPQHFQMDHASNGK